MWTLPGVYTPGCQFAHVWPWCATAIHVMVSRISTYVYICVCVCVCAICAVYFSPRFGFGVVY